MTILDTVHNFWWSFFQERQKKQEELKHIKNMKKQEIMERLDKLKEVTGNESIGFDPDDLEGDFDPAEHDRLMKVSYHKKFFWNSLWLEFFL